MDIKDVVTERFSTKEKMLFGEMCSHYETQA